MKRITHWLLNISFILVLAGMIGHEVFPHHHHNEPGEVHTCCESQHEDEPETKTATTCSILSNIRLEDRKPEIQIHTQELKHNQNDIHYAISGCCHSQHQIESFSKTPIYIPQTVFSETIHISSFSHRGPPLA